MKHYGDITKISGYDVPIVDVITGGSPCQDLSVAGKRAGLAGERSGLFMEQIRVVKEMRERDRSAGRSDWAVRPRYMVWENVPGAFSSGTPKGSDFAAVIEEIIKVAEPGADVCVCVPAGGWTKSGCFYAGDGSWSIAWRVHDAQFWGVPQRRKRIALVADFGGLSAPEILFERKGLRGNPAESGEAGQGAAEGIEGGAYSAVANTLTQRYDGSQNPAKQQGANIVTQAISFQERAGKPGGGKGILIQGEHVGALSTLNNQSVMQAISVDEKMGQTYIGHDIGNTLGARDYKQPQAVVASYGIDHAITTGGNSTAQGPCIYEDMEGTLKASGPHAVYDARCIGNGQLNQMSMAEQCNTLDTMHDQQAVITFDKEMYNCGEQMRGEPQARFDNVAPTVRADSHPSGVCTSTVRRLTPMECERLQGFPDGWTDIGEWTDGKGKKHKEADSPRYKALGNSIALPFWEWLARRICAQYERPATMASLFDGIGGFPLAFERAGAKAVWASEIEEFPIAVTKLRFPGETEGDDG